jgi:hypothetical protein
MADGNLDPMMKPTEEISVREVFGIDSDMKAKAFPKGANDRVPVVDPTYKFAPDTTLRLCATTRRKSQMSAMRAATAASPCLAKGRFGPILLKNSLDCPKGPDQQNNVPPKCHSGNNVCQLAYGGNSVPNF